MEKRIKVLICIILAVIFLLLLSDKMFNNRILPIYFSDIRNHESSGGNEELPGSSSLDTLNIKLHDREYLYKERRHTISEGCKKINRTERDRSELASNTSGLWIDKVHSIYYCPFNKVSSSFWKRVLTVMASKGNLSSPFEISLDGVRLPHMNDLSKDELNELKSKGTSFIITRDPYTRIFSGYEDKLYHSNLYYWSATGRQVVKNIRKDNDSVYQKYGFDVTFPEFINYILYQYESGFNIDHHFAPMIHICDPCSTYFEYVGKFETLQDDAPYLITKWRNQFDDVYLRYEDFETDTVLDTAAARVNAVFYTKKVLDEIKYPFIKIMLRGWRGLQIRGYISKYIPFPFKESDVETVTKKEYIDAIKTALKIPVNRTEVKLQREEALIQAYQQVSLNDMERLREYVLPDCLLFGYDDRPAKLFDRTESISNDFIYLDGLLNS